MPYYDYALDLILDSDSASTEILTEEQHELVESAAEMLYGLIHVRFILTSRGMSAMFEKYKVRSYAGRHARTQHVLHWYGTAPLDGQAGLEAMTVNPSLRLTGSRRCASLGAARGCCATGSRACRWARRTCRGRAP